MTVPNCGPAPLASADNLLLSRESDVRKSPRIRGTDYWLVVLSIDAPPCDLLQARFRTATRVASQDDAPIAAE